MSLIADVEKHRNDIVTDTYTVTWRELLGQYKDGDLIIDPEYQRLFRWDRDQQTQYVESILLNIPSPPLFLAKNADGRSEVIDGLQRVSTMLKFFAKDVFADQVQQSTDEEEERNNIRIPSMLTAGPIVPSLEGFSSETLPETLLRTLRYARISIILLEKESSTRARYEVFKRLNKLGSPLSDQEIRNCTARLFGKEFPTALRALAAKHVVRDALSPAAEPERKMFIEEMLLRLLAFNYSKTALKHEISEYLDEFMVYASEGKFKLTEEVQQRIERAFALIYAAFPDGKAFRFERGGFSTNLFDVVAIGVYENVDSLGVDEFRKRHETLLKSEELSALVGAGSNTRKKLEGRLSLGKSWFK